MANLIPAFVEFPSHTMTITWGDRQLRIRFIWRERTASWYFDVFELGDDNATTGDAIVLGRRVSPRWIPLLGLIPVGLPLDVVAFVDAGIGSDPYLRSDLGDAVRLLLLDRETEIPVPADPDVLAGDVLVTLL